MRRSRRSSRLIQAMALAALLPCGCARQEVADSAAAGDAAGEVSVESVKSMPTAFGIDPATLRHAGPADEVLVRANGRPFITAREFNDWLGTYPLNITSPDLAVASSQALEQMVQFRLMAQRARAAGYEAKVRGAGAPADDKSIVLMFIRDKISDITTVSDDAVREYEKQNPERFVKGENALPAEVKSAVVKGEILGQRLTEQIKGWMKDESVTFVKHSG